MKVFLHVCCANCAVYPVGALKKEGEVRGFFYNPNIHPLAEYKKRMDAVKVFGEKASFNVVYSEGYPVEEFFKNVGDHVTQPARCCHCYYMRLSETAREAVARGFEAFTTTLLTSVHQDHALVKDMGELVEKETGCRFLYRDFREGWQTSREEGRMMGLYRQKYCGCIYSERDRFIRTL